MTKRVAALSFCLVSSLILIGNAMAATDPRFVSQSADPLPTDSRNSEPSFGCGSGCVGQFFPGSYLYPPHVGDPHRPGFGVQRMWYSKHAIPAASDDRLNVKVGGVFGVVRVSDAATRDTALQFGIIGAYDGLYDYKSNLDNIGWNGDYGLELSGTLSKSLGAMVNWHHRSSHLGDEYEEKTGRKRLGYTREEFSGGLSYFPLDGWHLYGEAGWGNGLGNPSVMRPWRVQGGVEYTSSPVIFKNRIGWYGAFDTTSMEERGWHADYTVQAGFSMRSVGRLWRLGVEYYSGRPTVGDFFMVTERYLSGGLWMDW